MKYFVKISNHRYEIEVPNSSSVERLTVDGALVNVDYRWLRGDEALSLIMDGITHTVALTPDEDGCRIQVDGRDLDATIRNERSEVIRKLVGAKQVRKDAANEIKAPMPGLVVKINVAEGDIVTKGQGVMVVEAMKMENEIHSPSDGIVKKVMVETGKAVDKNELLLTLGDSN